VKSILQGMLIFPVAFMLVAAVFAEPVLACECGQVPGDARQAKEQASMVFRGKVLAEKEELVNGIKYRSALFLVHENWKGADHTQVIVSTPVLSCPFDWVKYNDYLIYAYEKDGIAVTDGCTRSAAIGQADADLALLGEGSPPEHIVDLHGQFGEDKTVYLIGFFASVAVVIGSVVVIIRRYRRFKQFQ